MLGVNQSLLAAGFLASNKISGYGGYIKKEEAALY
jgi:hypothetical protein